MFKFAAGIELMVFAVLFCSLEVRADIYKCVGTDGGTTYSQAPCQGNPEVVKVDGSRTAKDAGAVDCRSASRFALETARSMKGGVTSSEIFNRYGGLDSLSKGTINLINYVYGYRTNDSITSQRIAGLTQSLCQSQSLRNVSCEDLPLSFTDGLGGCDADEEGDLASGEMLSDSGKAPSVSVAMQPQFDRQRTQDSTVADQPSDEMIRECRKKYKDQIDRIDQQMRSGYSSSQGDSFREQLRNLRGQLRRC